MVPLRVFGMVLSVTMTHVYSKHLECLHCVMKCGVWPEEYRLTGKLLQEQAKRLLLAQSLEMVAPTQDRICIGFTGQDLYRYGTISASTP